MTFIRPWQTMVMTFWWPLRPMSGGEDTLTAPFTTHDYLVTTPHDITDNPCDDIGDLYCIHCPQNWDQLMKRTTRWWQGWLTTPIDNMVNVAWWPMWLLLMTCDDQSDDQNTTPTTLMTTGHYLGWSMWWPIEDPENFLMTSDDSIWQYLLPKSKVACLAVYIGISISYPRAIAPNRQVRSLLFSLDLTWVPEFDWPNGFLVPWCSDRDFGTERGSMYLNSCHGVP